MKEILSLTIAFMPLISMGVIGTWAYFQTDGITITMDLYFKPVRNLK